MKKLLLSLGALLIATNASAKEVVTAPIEVQEPTVIEEAITPVIEKPIFKPSGYIRMENRYFGYGEHDNVTQNYVRTEYSGAIQMTESDQLQWRVRSYEDLNSENSDKTSMSENTETRYRWLHSFGTLGDSKIKFATRFEMRQRDEYDKYELQTRFDFVDYIPDLDWLDTTKLAFSPKVRYIQYGETDDNGTGAGMDFEYYGILPYGFETELTVYYIHSENRGSNEGHYRNTSQYLSGTNVEAGEDTNSSNNIDVEYYIYWNHLLWESEDNFYGLNAYSEGGVDPFTYRDGSGDSNNLSLYVMPEAQLILNFNPATKLTFGVGAEYRDYTKNETDSMQEWTWQPYARLILKTVF